MKNKLGIVGGFILGIILGLSFILMVSPVLAQSCFSDAQCANGGASFRNTDNQIVREYCSSEGVCRIAEIKNVECTTNEACGNGYICDTGLTWTYTRTSGNPGPS